MDMRKQQIIAGLDSWIRQRPGLEWRNYVSGWNDTEGRKAYRAEVRRIGRQLREARLMLRAVEWRERITADDILEATRAYSGRLKIAEHVKYYTAADCPGRPCGTECDHRGASTFTIDYCTGQYWPTEYRAAVCAVLGTVLFDAWRKDCPPDDKLGKVSPGTWIRSGLRREFGRTLQSRWMD